MWRVICDLPEVVIISIVKKALKDSIKHWKRMIRWTTHNYKRLNVGSSVHNFDLSHMMYKYIREAWGGNHCPLCELFEEKGCKKGCKVCPLKTCSDGSPWDKVHKTCTVKEWIKAAKNMLKELKRVKREYVKNHKGGK